ncbi:MAG: endopeptidase La [Clostridia bacterium]|nr:endopeptidase La [Clostridia bacterium]
MSATKEKINISMLPVIPLAGTAAFPGMPMNLEISQKLSVAAYESAAQNGGEVVLIPQKSTAGKHLLLSDLTNIGTTARIKSSTRGKDGNPHLLLDCLQRAAITRITKKDGVLTAACVVKDITVKNNGGIKGEALADDARRTFASFLSLLPNAPEEVKFAVDTIEEPGLLADFIASNFLTRFEDKLKILAEFDPLRRLERLIVCMEEEMKILRLELEIHKKVRAQIDDNQRDYYLHEQLNVIRDELGMNEDDDDMEPRIREARLPAEVEEKLLKENGRLQKTPFGSAESTVLRNYIEVCLDLPWNKETNTHRSVEAAKKILDRDHEGLDEVKTRIIEYLAVRELTKEPASQILCLVGPPGVGKTSVAASVAEALGRKYVRVALGGVRDEADIRGHRKTYVGAMPGRIIDALTRAGVKNPLILLDEIDKLANDYRGDPSSALLEVLDSEQNRYFRDHFVELPFDLSQCVFLATANDAAGIPAPLYDRMEILEMKSYSASERRSIAKNHLIPKQLKRHGLSARNLAITDEALDEIISRYTREAGVRNLERRIAQLCRKCAAGIVAGDFKKLTVTKKNLPSLLGPEMLLPNLIPEKDTVGLVNGLAYTDAGGDMLPIECALLPGTGKVELTGSLGDVMKESAHIAVSFIRSRTAELGIDADFYKKYDIHIHAPEGAIPKDGPSAGVSMMTALASALTGRPVRRTVAMTGELTLLGRVLAIGGLKEKSMAALRAGAHTVIIPKENQRDLEKLPEEIRQGLSYVPVDHADEVLSLALCPEEKPLGEPVSQTLVQPVLAVPALVHAEPQNLRTGE